MRQKQPVLGPVILLACVVLFFSFPVVADSQEKAAGVDRPNVVLILLDNVGQEWFGCYGSEEQCTPNIDRLAREGVRAQNCYTPPVCGPSRTVLLTGRYPHTTGFRLHHDAALYGGGGLSSTREMIFPRLFQDAGYATAIAGKWQINNLYDEPNALTQHGFQQQFAWPGSIDRDRINAAQSELFQDMIRREAHEELAQFNRFIENRYWDPVFIRNGRRETIQSRFGPDEIQRFAVQFLREHRQEPFLLYVPMVLTHGSSFLFPVVHTPDNLGAEKSNVQLFADMLRYADKLIGQLVAELEQLKLRDNTIIVVASDNGTEHTMQARRNGRLVRGELYELTEAGGNVAFLVNSPNRIPGNRVLPLVDFTDVYPTLCELAHIPLNEKYLPDGRSFAKFLLNAEERTPHRKWILNEYHRTRVVRNQQFKLYSDGRLIAANSDPEERHDLRSSSEPHSLAAKRELQSVLDSLPADNSSPFLLRSLSAFKIRHDERQK